MKSASPSSQPPVAPKSRVFKPQTPVKLIVGLVVICTVLLIAIFYVINSFQRDFTAARMPGIIVEKNFVPNPRQEVTLINQGNMQVRNLAGDFSLTVRVGQNDGTSRDFIVSNVPQAMFESVEVGQRFDVGPYLLPQSALEDPAAPTANNQAPAESAPAEETPTAAPAETPAAAPVETPVAAPAPPVGS